MSTFFRLGKSDNKSNIDSASKHSVLDWKKCCICQNESPNESLRCPAESSNSSTLGAGYKSLADNLQSFNEIGALPASLKICDLLKRGEDFEITLKNNKAKWHDSCRLKYNKTKLNRALKRCAPKDESSVSSVTAKFTRKSNEHVPSNVDVCFFCDKPDEKDPLHQVSSLSMDTNIKQSIYYLQDPKLLIKLSGGDLIAHEAKYHLSCLSSLYNKVRALKGKEEIDNSDNINHGLALAGIVSYIEEKRLDEEIAPVFKLTDLLSIYQAQLEQLGTATSGRIHSTRLKERILSHFPDMQAIKQGRDILLVFNKDVGEALRKTCAYDADNDAACLAKAANIVRKEMFNVKSRFSGSFDAECQKNSVSPSLMALVSMILNGTNIKTPDNKTPRVQSALTISQLLMYNSYVKCRRRDDEEQESNSSANIKHNKQRETPLPTYLGLMVHTKTRKRELVDTLFGLGLSISYDRVLQISTDLGNDICSYYESLKAVCPPNLLKWLFTVAAVDNIDHNPSSTTSHEAFHGTAISLFQHIDDTNAGVIREKPAPSSLKDKKIGELPTSYTTVMPVQRQVKDAEIPKLDGNHKSECELIDPALQKEYRWLENVVKETSKDAIDDTENISWSAYHASSQPADKSNKQAISSLLPLFYDEAKSEAMISHSMDVVKSAIEILNPGQVPVVTFDQPLYTLAKTIQWNHPASYGEDKFVIMMGGLHIEMAALKVLGDLLEGSGWTSALVKADVAKHTNRVPNEETPLSLDDWCERQAKGVPQFQFWYIILQLQLHVMIFIRSIREANFKLYIDALTKIVPWFFALDHTNYARWMPVHLRDMVSLHKTHPEVFHEFNKGNFTVKKTLNRFSTIAIDQAHEQNNACIKGDGGAVGLTENPAALRRWMVSGPEMARVISEFEADACTGRKYYSDFHHHEESKHAQISFHRDTKSLTSAIEEMGNPFCETSADLLTLDSRDIADSEVVNTVRKIEKIGQEQYETYVTDRLVERTKPISEPIPRNRLHLFRTEPSSQKKSLIQKKVCQLKNDCALFSRMYISCQIRDGNLDEFFKHENQVHPPSLSQPDGSMRSGTKSDLVHCLEQLIPKTQANTNTGPKVDVVIVDGAAVVNMLKPGDAKTFQDYATQMFLPYIETQLRNAQRIDVIWDVYLEDSLKAETRSKRGKGVRRRVEPTSIIPGKWNDFLRIAENKKELFAFLAYQTMLIDTDKEILTTVESEVLCNRLRNTTTLSPCSHEEADTRMILHLKDAALYGHTKCTIRTVDTDVLVLAVCSASQIDDIEVWVAFGTGKTFRYIPAHIIAQELGPERSKALPVFHAITGCDTVSFFSGRGKKSAWDTWNAFEDVTPSFCALSSTPATVDEYVATLERFVILLYDRTSSETCINRARKTLFCQKGRAIDCLPPTRAALVQHIKRAAYQAGHCWSQMNIALPELPSPQDWGWVKQESGWAIFWTDIPEAMKACRELLRCGCKKSCSGRCKCFKAELPCTALCGCDGYCSRDRE